MEACEAMVAQGDPVAAALIAAATSPHRDIRAAIAWCLGRVGQDSEVEGALLSFVRDSDPRVRAAAAEAVGSRGLSSGVPHLVSLTGDPADFVRESAAGALGRLADEQGSAVAAELLDDAEPWVRYEAALVLGRREDERYLDRLIKSLYAEQSLVPLFGIVEALEAIGSPAALGELFTGAERPAIPYQGRLRCARSAERLIEQGAHILDAYERPETPLAVYENGLIIHEFHPEKTAAPPGSSFRITLYMESTTPHPGPLAVGIHYICRGEKKPRFESHHWLWAGQLVFAGESDPDRMPTGKICADVSRVWIPEETMSWLYDVSLKVFDRRLGEALIGRNQDHFEVPLGEFRVSPPGS